MRSRSHRHRGTELQPWAHRGCVQRPGGKPCSVAECEREHEHGAKLKRKRKHGRGHAGRECRCHDTGLRLRHIRIRGRRSKVDRSRRSGPCQRKRQYKGRGVKLWIGRLGRDVGTRERKHGRGRKRNMECSRGEPCTSWQRPCQGRGTWSRSSHAGTRRSGRGRPQCMPCQQQIGEAQKIPEAAGCTVMVPDRGLDKDVNNAPDKRMNSTR
ncbi:hypothetical protein SLEP1_g28390 [Rubroshorea leprosula]|uniref:Uncharacterized protein n=1 Tax=Rubroshorea leprosula TaxID=152421 RepID=A0AAV5K270_9ROSI|nr:hypothetical protein SLEP1_g28390 [Rubroshorea leprosula]